MLTLTDLLKVREVFGEDYLLDQLQEECAELIQAASKVKRQRNGSTPVAPYEAHRKLIEEISDVLCMIRNVEKVYLDFADRIEVNALTYDKEKRMMERTLEAEQRMKECNNKSDSAVAFE